MTFRQRLRAAPEPVVPVTTDPAERRALVVELVIVGVLTFGFSALSAILSLIDAQLSGGIASSTVALNARQSDHQIIDLIRQLMSFARLAAIGALGVYLLWRSGIRLPSVGLGRPVRRDVPPGLALAALIGLPGLALVAVARLLGLNAQLVPAQGDGPWWQWITLTLIAVGNAVAEEVVVVAYFMTRLKQLGVGTGATLASSAILRGGYHLYQGFGAGVGNMVMGLVFGRWFQATGRVWPLIVAHSVIDVVAFLGYALLAPHLGWLTG
ncbi:MAG: CPBP family intramembrane metalloprotease [Gordonia sp. (in: high G+C Gram-positive bacteria)]